MSAPREPIPTWRDRWDGGRDGVVVLDLGVQPSSDVFPAVADPGPDPASRLRMVFGRRSRLLQLEDDPTTPTEVTGLEPAALVAQAEASVADAEAAGLLAPASRVLHFASPHGGSWRPQLERFAPREAGEGAADLVVDVHGMMHEPDQRAAFEARRDRLAPGGVLLFLIHDASSFTRQGMWHALRTGHFAYYSAPALVAMGEELGLTAIGAWTYPLYQHGTTMLAFARADGPRGGERASSVAALVSAAEAAGATDPAHLAAGLQHAFEDAVAALRGWLDDARARGLSVAGYGAASRAVSLLASADATRDDVAMIGDGAAVKHGRRMPGTTIPIVAPGALLAARPDRVLLFVADLLDEMRAAMPEVEASGARWVVVDPTPREVPPAQPPSDAR